MEYDKIVESALKSYDGEFISKELFSKQASIIYLLVDSDNKKYALKIYENASNLDDNELEYFMINTISQTGGISVPEIIKNKEEENVTIIRTNLSNTNYRIVVSKWLEGIDLKDHENEELFIHLGALIAKLHLTTKGIKIPQKIKPRKWDKVFYFRDEEPVYQDDKYKGVVSSEFKDLMDTAIPILDDKLNQFYVPEAAQLLHGDLNPWNIKIHQGHISILDFEDLILGHPIHDLGILFYYYQDNENFSYENVIEWVLKGYQKVNPDEKISLIDLRFISMARRVNLLNYVLTLEGDYKEFIEDSLKLLKQFLRSN